MAAGIYTLLVEQGATLSKTFLFQKSNGTPFDFTGYTPTAQIRDSTSQTGTPRLTLTCAYVGADPASGTINVSATAAQTALLTGAGNLVWDLITTAGAVVRRRVEGVCLLRKRVTQ